MPRKPISFELDFMIKDIFPRFTVKQFDDVSFNIIPMNQGKPYDTTNMIAKIFVGVNNDMFMQTTGMTVSSDNINVLLDRNMLQKQGRAYAEIELTDENGTITSSSFIFDIDPKIGEGGQIPGEYEGFVVKYERLIAEFRNQVNATTTDCTNKVNVAISNLNTQSTATINNLTTQVNAKIKEADNKIISIQNQTTEVIDSFNTTSSNTINKFNTDGTNAISSFNSKGTSAINTINTNSSNAINKFTSDGNSAINVINNNADNKLTDFERRFQNMSTSQTSMAEVVDARGESASLRDELRRIEHSPYVLFETVEG